MILVDINIVFASLVRQVPWHQAARQLHALDADWWTESYALVELSNVLSRYVRAQEIAALEAVALLADGEERLRNRTVTVAHAEALKTAIALKVSAYDARYLVAAKHFETRLVTEDAKLRAAAPDLTRSLREALQ
jgi:predicted nucleic acid-binding protein